MEDRGGLHDADEAPCDIDTDGLDGARGMVFLEQALPTRGGKEELSPVGVPLNLRSQLTC